MIYNELQGCPEKVTKTRGSSTSSINLEHEVIMDISSHHMLPLFNFRLSMVGIVMFNIAFRICKMYVTAGIIGKSVRCFSLRWPVL
jgi:hypothetical protein